MECDLQLTPYTPALYINEKEPFNLQIQENSEIMERYWR